MPPKMKNKTVTVTFVAQQWVGDYAVEVEPLGPTTWEVPAELVRNMPINSYESDALREHPNAPEWVLEWDGPFECNFDPDLT
jgi:hypothetical protein